MCSANVNPQPRLQNNRQTGNVISLPTQLLSDPASLRTDVRTSSPCATDDAQYPAPVRPSFSLTVEQTTQLIHEMRSPLSVILNVLNSCQKIQLTEPERTRLTLALEEASRLKRLTDEILSSARSVQEPIPHWEIIPLPMLMRDVIDITTELPVAADRPIVLTSTIPNVLIRGDRDQLKQVFLNLLVNACEAVEQGQRIMVHCRWKRHSHQVILHIRNGGRPIPVGLLPVLGYQQTTTKSSGHGLGLLIVRKIVRDHAGLFEIESSGRRGTTARVQLPLIQP